MTTNETSKYDPLTYRRLSTACFLLAGVALFVASVIDFPYFGIAVYAVLGVAGFGVRHLVDATLFDERDGRLHDRASGSTITIISYTGIVAIPAAVGLDIAGYLSLSPEWFGFMMAFPALIGTHLVARIYHRYR